TERATATMPNPWRTCSMCGARIPARFWRADCRSAGRRRYNTNFSPQVFPCQSMGAALPVRRGLTRQGVQPWPLYGVQADRALHPESLVTGQASRPRTGSRSTMAMHITTDIVESFLQCRYKSYLQLVGEQGVPSEYERLLRETRARVQLAGMDKLLTRYGASASLRHLAVTPAVLKRGALLVLDATIEDERLMLRFDALQRVPGPSQLGDFHYIPVLCHDAERPSHIPRSLLAICGLFLGAPGGRPPAYGLLIHGQQCE